MINFTNIYKLFEKKNVANFTSKPPETFLDLVKSTISVIKTI